MESEHTKLFSRDTAVNVLLRTYLHVYCHVDLKSLPQFRLWTSGNRTKYAAVDGQDNIDKEQQASTVVDSLEAEPEAERLDETIEDDAEFEDPAGESKTSGPRSLASKNDDGRPHSGACSWHCTNVHISIHIGLFALTTLITVVSLLCWTLFSRLSIISGTIPAAPDIDLTEVFHNDYLLDPHWKFDDAPRRREYHWTITDQTLNPDGVFRPMMVINKQFPGPLIECNEGDTIAVTVVNEAVNATSIHWHGLFQNGTNYMDGTVGVTQCPIATHQSFEYEFKVERQSGTYWYHGHYGPQAADGLLGPLIVHSKYEKRNQLLEYSTDRVIMIQDHYHDTSGELLVEYLKSDGENDEPVPDSSLLNGRNVRNCDDFPNRLCDNSTLSLPEINLDPKHAHRLRIINTGAFAEFELSIDEHEFAVTEVDGTDVHPVSYNLMKINPAQRYSIVVQPQTDAESNYWLRAKMVTTCFAYKNHNLDPLLKAIVRYGPEDESKPLPTTKEWQGDGDVICRDMNTTELVPVQAIAAPPKADIFLYLRSNFEIGDWRLSRGFFNTTSWRPNIESPLLHRSIDAMTISDMSILVDGAQAVNHSSFDLEHEFVLQTSGVKTIDVAVQNFDDGSHPMHLHSTKYWVLAAGHGHFNATEVYPTLDLSNPLRRDTATIESYGWILIRFIADNPGLTALHCHNVWHAEAGLLMNFLIRAEIVQSWTLPKANLELCNAEGLLRGAGPKDEIWYGTPSEYDEDF